MVSIQSAAFKYFESRHRALREGLRGLRVGSTRCNWVTLPLQYVSVACCSAPTLISITLARSHLDQSHHVYRNVLLISIPHYVVERKSSLVFCLDLSALQHVQHGSNSPFHPMCDANSSGAVVLFTAKRSMVESVLEVVCLMDLNFFVKKPCALWTAEHSLLHVIIPNQYLQKHTVYATELHWCCFCNCIWHWFYFLMTDIFDLLYYLTFFVSGVG